MALSFLRTRYLDELEDTWNEHGSYDSIRPLKDYIKEDEFKRAMKVRGLPVPAAVKRNSKPNLSPLQRAVIRTVVDYHDGRPVSTKLKALDVTTREYQGWLKDPLFQTEIKKQLDKNQSNLPTDAKLALSKLIVASDLNAIKYYNELTGIYRPNQETLLNLGLILGKLMDILTSYLRPDQLAEVADKLDKVLLNADGAEREVIDTIPRELNSSERLIEGLILEETGTQ